VVLCVCVCGVVWGCVVCGCVCVRVRGFVCVCVCVAHGRNNVSHAELQ